MKIVKYLVPLSDSPPEYRYGTPVEVWIHGEPFDLVLQLPLPDQKHAVVHWQSGAVMVPIGPDVTTGDPTQQAQAACDAVLARRTLQQIRRAIDRAATLNVELLPA